MATTDRRVATEFEADAASIGALEGSARGARNVRRRIEAMERLGPVGVADGRLLDVGCANGAYTRALADRFAAVDAIDIELDRLDAFAVDKPDHVAVHLMSANEMTFDDDTFDQVTLIEVLEHVADPAAALAEIARVLVPEGSLFLTTPSRLWPFEQHGVKLGGRRFPGVALPGLVWCKPLHRRLSPSDAFTRSDLGALAEDAGLKLAGVTWMMPPLDSLPEGHVAHRVTERAERSPLSALGQTIVARLTTPAR